MSDTPRELYIFCKRGQRCDGPGFRRVRFPCQQRKGGYCSLHCAAAANNNCRHVPRDVLVQTGRQAAARNRQAVLDRIAGLSPLEAFRVGYRSGLYSKHRQIRRLVDELRAARPQRSA